MSPLEIAVKMCPLSRCSMTVMGEVDDSREDLMAFAQSTDAPFDLIVLGEGIDPRQAARQMKRRGMIYTTREIEFLSGFKPERVMTVDDSPLWRLVKR